MVDLGFSDDAEHMGWTGCNLASCTTKRKKVKQSSTEDHTMKRKQGRTQKGSLRGKEGISMKTDQGSTPEELALYSLVKWGRCLRQQSADFSIKGQVINPSGFLGQAVCGNYSTVPLWKQLLKIYREWVRLCCSDTLFKKQGQTWTLVTLGLNQCTSKICFPNLIDSDWKCIIYDVGLGLGQGTVMGGTQGHCLEW